IGEDNYVKFTNEYLKKVEDIKDKQQCADTLFNWLKHFRKGHIWFGIENKNTAVSNSIQKDKKGIQEQFKSWKTFPYQEKEFNNYISKISTASFEGIWQSSVYTIGVRKVNNNYIGFIINGDGAYWSKSQIKFTINDSSNILSATYYMQDHSPRNIKKVEMLGNNYLQLDWITLKRISPKYSEDKYDDIYYKFNSSNNPVLEKLSEKTIVLRIPSFSDSEKPKIDSIINTNFKLITSTKNLIIDLRNNGGGSDMSFQSLLPIIYTNPIREVGVEFLSTPLNNQRMKEFANDTSFSKEDRLWAKNALVKLNKYIGSYVSIEDSTVTNLVLDTIYQYPKNVGIIINEGNASTTEQFLLAAKQSKKVKLFGTTTAGILDISNMYFVNSPCGNFKLGYCLSKSKRIPYFTIDGKGIQPDFYFVKSIPEYYWIKNVNDIISN
ncbi:MAG: peptidase S41, partial [Bacteroidia bacterium]|nr:peptidase S41 [Bacteroidia bacterium]